MIDENTTQPIEDDAFRDEVRRTAYFLWEQDGRPDGRHEEYYLKALEIHRRRRNFEPWLQDGPPRKE